MRNACVAESDFRQVVAMTAGTASAGPGEGRYVGNEEPSRLFPAPEPENVPRRHGTTKEPSP
jgi:hypothetical protein